MGKSAKKREGKEGKKRPGFPHFLLAFPSSPLSQLSERLEQASVWTVVVSNPICELLSPHYLSISFNFF